jgi:hypothetical protein
MTTSGLTCATISSPPPKFSEWRSAPSDELVDTNTMATSASFAISAPLVPSAA